MTLFNKSSFYSFIINLFHYYAFGVYAFSSVILAPQFFHTDSEELTKTVGLITLSITLLLKPLGSLVFGHIGDVYGRKRALVSSLFIITFSTCCIGLLPTYQMIGLVSSASLLLCLFFQGLCIGGQYTGAIIFIQEHTKRDHAALACGTMGAIGVLGVLMGTASSYLFYHFSIVSWGWRIPFLITGFIGPLLLYYVMRMMETPEFLQHREETKKIKVPLVEVLKNFKRMMISTMCLASIPVSLFYVSTVYVPNFFLTDKIHRSSDQILAISILAQAMCIPFNVLFGFIADRVGKERMLKVASFTLIFLPGLLFTTIFLFDNFYVVIFISLVYAIFAAFYAGPATAYLLEKYPIIGKYSGMGLGITIGESLGAFGPVICITLGTLYGPRFASTYFVMFLGCLSFIGLLIANKCVTLKSLKEKTLACSH